MIQSMIRWFIPDESRFYDYVVDVADSAHRAAGLFDELARAEGRTAQLDLVERIREAERDGDIGLRTIAEALDATFVTPIDREDLYHLASSLEVISDFVSATANHLTVHHMEVLPEGTRELSKILLEATALCVEATKVLREGGAIERIRTACQGIKQLEHDADVEFRNRLGTLFANEKDAIQLIKSKEFLEGLEDAVDRCHDVATVLQAVLIKNG
jgi:uncharacterized protein